jgi:cytosine/adenosine deaminase-related metal-dependent hydrolase
MKAIKNVKIYDYDKYIESGYIIFKENIIEVGKMEHFKFEGQIIDGKGKLILPGLVNAHTHIYSTLFRGLSLKFNPKTFKDILTDLWWKFDKELKEDEIYYSGLVYGIESLKNGVTTLIDHHASGEIDNSLNVLKKAIVDKLNMRIILAFETSDRFDIDKCIKENKTFLNYKDEFCTGLFGMHASMSLSENTLEKIKGNLNNNPIHIHIAESEEDEIDCFNKYSKSIIERFNEKKLINDNSILAHCVHINEKEAKILKEKNVFVALNPSSNLNNNVGIFNYELLKELKILVGTDGLGSNVAKEIYNLNLMIKKSINSPIGINNEKIIEFINNSYEIVNRLLNIKIGKFRQSYKADFLLVDYDNPTPMNNLNIFSHILFGVFENLRPEKVFIDGKEVLSNYSVHNQKEIYKESEKVATKLFKKFGDD